jgi:hypothetical protein
MDPNGDAHIYYQYTVYDPDAKWEYGEEGTTTLYRYYGTNKTGSWTCDLLDKTIHDGSVSFVCGNLVLNSQNVPNLFFGTNFIPDIYDLNNYIEIDPNMGYPSSIDVDPDFFVHICYHPIVDDPVHSIRYVTNRPQN